MLNTTMHKTRFLFIIGILGVILGSTLMFTGTVYASSDLAPAESAKEAACRGLGEALGGSTNCSEDAGAEIDSTIASIVNILSIIVGFISVLMIIIGGLKYITSGGDSSGISSAKNTVIYAIVGLVIVALAQILVELTVAKVIKEPTP